MAPTFSVAQSADPVSQYQPVVLKVRNLSFNHSGLAVFANLQADIRAGVTLVQGGDGRGKTTFLRLMAGDLPLQSGQVTVHGVDLTADATAYQRAVFWVDPRSIAFDAVSADAYFDQQRRTWPHFDDRQLPALIEGLSLTEFLYKPIYMLSTGSKRKVWLAAAFASNAAVALLDDPFAALDKPSIRYVTDLLQGVASQAACAVVISGYDAPDSLDLAGTIDLGD